MKNIQKIALYLFFFSINFEVWDPMHTGGYFSVSKLMGFIYLLTMLPLIFSYSTRNETKALLWPLGLFFIVLTFSNIFNENSTITNFIDISILHNIILFWILINHESYESDILEKGMLSFAIGSIVLAILFNLGIGIEYSVDRRISIFGDNQNNIGMRMCVSIIILILTVIQNPLQLNKIRILLLLPIPVMLQLMALSGSRVAFVSFLITFITGGILLKTRTGWQKLGMFIIAVITVIIVWQYLMHTEVMKLRLLQSIQERDLSGRELIWQRIIPLIKNNPVFGVGTVGYKHFTMAIFGEIKSPHNVFLEVLCYTGFIGLIIYSVFLFKIFKRGYFIYRKNGILLPILLLIPIFGLLLSGQLLGVKTGWIIFAYITANSLKLSTNELED